ncbi:MULTISPECIES: hypothetical protein [Pseudomonas]|uniref:Uncharacterized protein n=1 Tax=Pseudomonas helleri TaxID=1608996 RepID=A0A6L5HSV6_9PSED|nr:MULTISPECIES: hypothetical protein [Pseudomonas]MQT47901.1 hypothetical protein [Pseudomonas helleri]MQT60264.1 hypothetical protein [Pseudomonas sp. FSL R10-0399]MQT88730.1 hypothetical protein [Pseudomonas helleri]MQU06456.1 hypothetical protein [Pseudomonas helleri]
MRTANGYQQGYNAQAAVDESLLIVAATVSNMASDTAHLMPVPHSPELADRPVRREVLRRQHAKRHS